MISNKETIRLAELDALRGLAAMYVLIFHFSLLVGADFMFFRMGVTGVDLFFIISGFVIFMTLEKTNHASQFIVSRLSRLYPSYIIMMAITLLAVLMFEPERFPSLGSVIVNLGMLQPVFSVEYIDESYWTLVVEMQFYVLMLIVFLTANLKSIEIAGILFLLIIAVYGFISAGVSTQSKAYIIPRSLFPLIGHFPLFFAGIIFYRMKKYGMTIYRRILIVICFLFTMYLFKEAGKAHEFIGLYEYAGIITLYFILFYLFIAGKLRFLICRPLNFLGMISYGLYLIHQEFGRIMYNYFTGLDIDPVVVILILITIVITLSYLVTRFIEKPVMRAIRSQFAVNRKLNESAT